jgi:hypothetical protein
VLLKLQPDIIVLTELMTGAPPVVDYSSAGVDGTPAAIRNRLVGVGGQFISTNLMTALSKEATAAVDYRMVPPRNLSENNVFKHGSVRGDVHLATNECVAILFNSKSVQFSGPYYNRNIKGIATPYTAASIAAPNASPYVGAWVSALPTTKLSTKMSFGDPDKVSGMAIPIPEFATKPIRQPFHTQFQFLDSAGAVKKLELLSVHLSPSGTATQKAAKIAALANKAKALGQTADTYSVVLGDFNTGLNSIAADFDLAVNMEVLAPGLKVRESTLYGAKLSNLNPTIPVLGPLANDFGGSYPAYNFLQHKPTDNIAVYPKGLTYLGLTPAKTIIANPLVGYPYYTTGENPSETGANETGYGDYDYSPDLAFNAQGKKYLGKYAMDFVQTKLTEIPATASSADRVAAQEKICTNFATLGFRKFRVASDHLPLMIEFDV